MITNYLKKNNIGKINTEDLGILKISVKIVLKLLKTAGGLQQTKISE